VHRNRIRRSAQRSDEPYRRQCQTRRCRSAGRSTGSICRTRHRWLRRYAGCRGPDPAGLAGAGSSRRWPRSWCAGGCRSAPRTVRRATRRSRTPTRAAHYGRSSGSNGRIRRWRCSPTDGRRAVHHPMDRGTCLARTTCRRAPNFRPSVPGHRPGWVRGTSRASPSCPARCFRCGRPPPRCSDTAAHRSPAQRRQSCSRARWSGIRSREQGIREPRGLLGLRVGIGCVAHRSEVHPSSISSLFTTFDHWLKSPFSGGR